MRSWKILIGGDVYMAMYIYTDHMVYESRHPLKNVKMLSFF